MKEFFKKIAAFLMAFVVMFSTMSFSYSEHYCGEHLVDIGVFSKAESCGMEMQKPTKNGDCSIQKDNCCNNVLKQFEGQNELQPSANVISFEQQVFITAFIDSYVTLFNNLDNNVSSYEEYSPPLVFEQIYKLDETYLI